MSITLDGATLAAVSIVSSGSSLASNANAISGAQDPTASAYGGTGSQPGYRRGQFTFNGTFGGVPAANGVIQVYWVYPTDGTLTGTPGSYETDPGRSTAPNRHLAATIRLDPVNTTQGVCSELVDMPYVPFKCITVNAATGQTLAATWTLTLGPATDKGV